MTTPWGGPDRPVSLADRVRGLVHRACTVYGGGPAMPELMAAATRLDDPLRVALAGRVKAGKSTLLNALVGQELAATDAGECTRVVTWYRDGHTYRAVAHPWQGPPRPLASGPTGAPSNLAGLAPGDVDHIVVDWPSGALRAMTLIDTPGLDSLSTELSRRTETALAADEGGAAEADAVVYLARHVHSADVRFLETFRDDPAERRPINTLGVLARADEVGHGRPDAIESARRVAERYSADPRMRALCQTVVPVAGLLAATAATLREDEFRAFTALAGEPEEATELLLLTADRFTAQDATGAGNLDPSRRAALLERYGMFGVRLSLRLIRSGAVTTAGALARELTDRSGLGPLRAALLGRFAGRAEVLKARSALLAVDAVLARHPVPASASLAQELEMLTAGAHEFAEIRLLDSLRTGDLMLTDTERADAERLLGGDGVHAYSRLGCPVGTPPDEAGRLARSALAQWRRRAEHPASTRDVRDAARVIVRTCEALVMGPAHQPVPAPSAQPGHRSGTGMSNPGDAAGTNRAVRYS